MKKYNGHDEVILDDFVDFVCKPVADTNETNNRMLAIMFEHIRKTKELFAEQYIDREEYS